MQLPGTASSSLQLESPTCSLNSRSVSSSGRSPFQSSITNVAQFPLSTPPPRSSQTPGGGDDDKNEFYANVGNAIRTLRVEIPLLFQQDFTYDIYREDVVFRDPRNTFKGLKNYKTIFWSLRFHGRLFFSRLYVDVQRIWQPDDAQIRMRWTVHGIPRVPWKAEGIFDGVSTFKLDRKGKIYEHQVDNVILRDPPMLRSPLFAGLNLTPLLQPQPQTQPCPGAWYNNAPLAAEERFPQPPCQT
ncbi:hypothetical protein WJX75_005160 [Coccomyxa subellipsoidea]|uniref:Uncharacterized protein n=1 Tax=Coccomyxa subellipsoidea TaxID=248742 RepID=A0ABR2YE41_9CHLO